MVYVSNPRSFDRQVLGGAVFVGAHTQWESHWLHGCWMWISAASPAASLTLVQICVWQEPFGQHRVSDRFGGPFLVFCLWTIWHVNLTGGKNGWGDCCWCYWPRSEIEQGQGVRPSFTAQPSSKWSSASLLVLNSAGRRFLEQAVSLRTFQTIAGPLSLCVHSLTTLIFFVKVWRVACPHRV